ncbi:MAG: sigma-70 family RNA polymerase sigma factor [Nitriliruptorales bacterium]|nr:sigma-70 family RNA polymerase sigma factor [Nitriliruptorales bacterium]
MPTTTAATETEPGIDPELKSLVADAKEGDEHAFAAIYDRYVDQTFGFIYRRVGHRQTAEDLTGDVFFRAFRRLDTFEWQGKDLGAWIMTIARNRVYDHFKSARFRLERSTDQTPETPETGIDDPERVSVARDMAKSLGYALEQLKDDHREVIELRFIHNMSVADTAEIMDRSVGATKALQYRALRALAEHVKDVPGLSEIAVMGLGGMVWLLRAFGGLL